CVQMDHRQKRQTGPGRPGHADFSVALADFEETSLRVPAGGSAKARIACSGRSLPLWTLDAPKLCLASVRIAGEAEDRMDMRFGYREFRIKGKDLLLNGKKILLKGDSWHFMGIPQMTRRYPWAWYSAVKAANGNAVRLHAQPYPEFYMDMADEMGIAVLDESAIWESHCAFNFFEDVFWERANQHIEKLVLRDRSHPSVFGWSIENEVVDGSIVSGHSPEERSVIMEKCGRLYDICRALDPSRDWVSGDGCEDLGGRLPVNMLHYKSLERCREIASQNKPWGVGECTAAYYGTPRELSRWNGGRAYESIEGKMEALAYESWEQLAVYQRANGASYLSVFDLVWYALKPLPLGQEDTARAPEPGDGVFFDRQREGQIGVQPERLGPYATTLNPGYDPGLPMYEEWPMFEAVKDAFAPGEAKKGKWSYVPEPKPGYKYPEPWIERVCYIGGDDLRRTLRIAGWDLSGGDGDYMLLIDGSRITKESLGGILKKADAFTRSGRIVFVWGITPENAGAVSRITGCSAECVERHATSLVSRYIPNDILYFTESANRDIMDLGIGGEILEKGNRIIDPCNTEWYGYNYLTPALLLRSERENKPDASAFVSVPKDRGKVLLWSIGTGTDGDRARLYAETASFLGIKHTPVSISGNTAEETVVRLLLLPEYDNKQEDSGKGGTELTADKNGVFTFDKSSGGEAVYLSLRLWSPRALDELLAEPNVPQVTLAGSCSGSLTIYVNGRAVFDNSQSPSADGGFATGPLPLGKGANRIVFSLTPQDGELRFGGRFSCTDMDYWSTVVCDVDKGK
ncbi:MAG: hypothetical protein ILO36_05540, partial [Abditibacteriota bacterium]|nr:hypothetical protein [Abditibacteriota bacterium]